MKTNQKAIAGWSFLLRWILVNTLGTSAGWVIGLYVVVGNLSQTITAAIIMLGVTLGVSIGVLQSLVLRQYLHRINWWVLTNILGWTIGFILGFPLSLVIDGSRVMDFAIIGAMIGILTGVMQFLILRQSTYRASWWILITALGWTIGFAVGSSLSSSVPRVMVVELGEVTDETVSLAVAGAVAGAITGISLIRLFQSPITSLEFKASAKSKRELGVYLILFCLAMIVFFTNRQEQLNNLKFSEFNRADRIQIQFSQITASPHEPLETNDPERIEFARKFIERYPDGWERPGLTPIPATSFYVEFFDEEEKVGLYGVGSNFLVYGPYWRPISEEERMLLTGSLGIPIE
jgi:hypothetical protein